MEQPVGRVSWTSNGLVPHPLVTVRFHCNLLHGYLHFMIIGESLPYNYIYLMVNHKLEFDNCIIFNYPYLRTAVQCPSLSAPNNGNVTFTNNLAFGSLATYSCKEGYEVNGARIRICLSTGDWTSIAPTCPRE